MSLTAENAFLAIEYLAIGALVAIIYLVVYWPGVVAK